MNTKTIFYRKSHYEVLDIYLFINPLDINCVTCIDEFMHYATNLEHKTYLHIIPFCSLKAVHHYLKKNKLDSTNFALHNDIYNLAYDISLIYKTASCQGKKKAFNFLKNLSNINQLHKHELTKKDLQQAILHANLDLELIRNEYRSTHTKECYLQDLNIAHQFNITKTPSIVIFNANETDGILYENITLDQLIPIIESTLSQPHKKESTPY